MPSGDGEAVADELVERSATFALPPSTPAGNLTVREIDSASAPEALAIRATDARAPVTRSEIRSREAKERIARVIDDLFAELDAADLSEILKS